MKPYQAIPIDECGEPLRPLPVNQFSVVTPHPYQVLGAPYGDRSPYWLRASLIEKLCQAQTSLRTTHSTWRLCIFDAYRPIAVQAFMVDHTARDLAQQQGQAFDQLSQGARQVLLDKVHQFWASPSHDPHTPPPHSTGAAVDITVVEDDGSPVDMGSPIDEISERSHPDYFQAFSDPRSQRIHRDRALLRACLETVGFRQHPNEWWHFSCGDQLWAWLMTEDRKTSFTARYGRV